MRLKGITGTDLISPVQKLNRNGRERNSNQAVREDDNSTNRYDREWSNSADSVTGRDDNATAESRINLNNNIPVDQVLGTDRKMGCPSPASCQDDDSYEDYEGQSSSSLDVSPHGDEYRCFSQEDATDSDFSDDGNPSGDSPCTNGGIVNPNYPGFQEFDNDRDETDEEDSGSNGNCKDNNNGDVEISESVNHLGSVENFQKAFYDKPKFDIVDSGECEPDDKQENVEPSEVDDSRSVSCPEKNDRFDCPSADSGAATDESAGVNTSGRWFVAEDIVTTTVYPVSGIYETAVLTDDESDERTESGFSDNWKDGEVTEPDKDATKTSDTPEKVPEETEEDAMKKEEKTQMNVTTKNNLKMLNKTEGTDHITYRGSTGKQRTNSGNRRSLPPARDRGGNSDLGFFDVYNIETAMPKIDMDAIESHLKAAREEERRKRTDREEIRRRLAMGTDNDDYYGGEKMLRKPSLQARLQSGMNLQICFMNETISDNESPNSDPELGNFETNTGLGDGESTTKESDNLAVNKCSFGSIPPNHVRPSTSLLTLPLKKDHELRSKALTAADFFACQAQLQAEARLALSQAKEMARMQMEVERQNLKTSPITEMVRNSLEKVGVPFPRDRRRLSRQILTEMNIAQLQVIVNDLHTQIEQLNENLVKFLIGRDDLHMEQDSMLVDIEDLTRYLGAKEKPQDVVPNVNMVHLNNNINICQSQSRISIRSKD